MKALLIITTTIMGIFQLFLYSNKDSRKLMNDNGKTKIISNKSKFIVAGSYIATFLFSLVYVLYGKEKIALYGLQIFTLVFILDIFIQYFIMFKNYKFKLSFTILFLVLSLFCISILIVLFYVNYGFNYLVLSYYIINIVAICIIWFIFYIKWKKESIAQRN